MRNTLLCVVVFAANACTDGPTCGPGTRAVGDACLADVDCPLGYLAQDGECVAMVDDCGPGSSLVNGACVPDVTRCAEGTHTDGGLCVPDGLPDADVLESTDANFPAEVVLPEDGSISLGGRVDTPVDVDGDTFVDADFDDFVFYAEAGTWLRIRATSDDAALPAFMIVSASTGEDGWPLFSRYAVEPNDDVTSREVYLPRSDSYVLWVTDYAHLWPFIFGWPTVPVGGDAFTYRVVIENLGAPVPVPVSSLPWFDSGALDDGALRFYSVDANDNVAVLARSVGVPLPDSASEIYPILSVFADDGSWVDAAGTGSVDHDVDLLLPGGRAHLLVQDFMVVVGPHRDYAVELTPVVPVDCGTSACDLAVSDDHVMLTWALEAGDFLTAGVSHDGNGAVDLALIDGNLHPLLARQEIRNFNPGAVALFADHQRNVYLWLQKQKGAEVETFTVDQAVVATPMLSAETPLTVEVTALPDAVMADSGIARLEGNSGQLVLFDPPTPYGNSWLHPTERLLTTGLDAIGPATDALSPDFAFLAPLMAVLPADGTYLHVVQDPEVEVAGSTYDTGFVLATATPASAATVGAPTVVAGSLDAGVALLAHTGSRWQRTTIEVTATGFRPEISVLNRGTVTSLYPEVYWQADDGSQQLGRVAHAAASGDTVTVEHVAFGAEDLILITDADGGTTGTFDATIEVFDPPANDTCAAATVLELASDSVTVQASSAGATDTVDLDWSNPCTSRPSQGPDLFFAIDAASGETFDVGITADHAAVIYLLDACAGTCLAGASGDSQSFTWQAETSGRVIVGVDGYVPTALGDFSLEVQRQ